MSTVSLLIKKLLTQLNLYFVTLVDSIIVLGEHLIETVPVFESFLYSVFMLLQLKVKHVKHENITVCRWHSYVQEWEYWVSRYVNQNHFWPVHLVWCYFHYFMFILFLWIALFFLCDLTFLEEKTTNRLTLPWKFVFTKICQAGKA